MSAEKLRENAVANGPHLAAKTKYSASAYTLSTMTTISRRGLIAIALLAIFLFGKVEFSS